MGPPNGGRQEVTPRLMRHFNIIGYVEMSDSSKSVIFGSILTSFLTPFDGNVVSMVDNVVKATTDLFSTIVKELLPTPSKSHYTFNLRDLAKVCTYELLFLASNILKPYSSLYYFFLAFSFFIMFLRSLFEFEIIN